MHTYVSMLNQKTVKVLLAHKYAFSQRRDRGTMKCRRGYSHAVTEQLL